MELCIGSPGVDKRVDRVDYDEATFLGLALIANWHSEYMVRQEHTTRGAGGSRMMNRADFFGDIRRLLSSGGDECIYPLRRLQ